MKSRFDISDKLALVTGSSKGIGLALAKGLLQEGCRVVFNARNYEQLKKTTELLIHTHPQWVNQIFIRNFDVSNEDEVMRCVADIESSIGGIDILVNNAGTQIRGDFTEYT
ncbi:gluconate 5-dehydrogenase, partial [Klebsiella pneumoniae]